MENTTKVITVLFSKAEQCKINNIIKIKIN